MKISFLLVVLGLCCLQLAESSPQFGALAGLGALRTASLSQNRRFRFQGPGYGKTVRGIGLKRRGRSVDTPSAGEQDLLLATVDHLDSDGCIAKLLCLTQTKDKAARTRQENLFLDTFADNTQTLSSFNALFVHASKLGLETRDPAACWESFPKCALDEEDLQQLLFDAWGCECSSSTVEQRSSENGDDSDEDD